ncbi:MAG: DUF5615 family PIN-like protein [Sulfolobales archaeon]
MNLEVLWIPGTEHRGINDKEVIDIANELERIVLTRDSDFLEPSLRKRSKYGIAYIDEPIGRDSTRKPAEKYSKGLRDNES